MRCNEKLDIKKLNLRDIFEKANFKCKKPGRSERGQRRGTRPPGSAEAGLNQCHTCPHSEHFRTRGAEGWAAGHEWNASLAEKRKNEWGLGSSPLDPTCTTFNHRSWKARPLLGQLSPKEPVCCVSWVSSPYPEKSIWKASFFSPENLRYDSQVTGRLGPSPKGRTTRINHQPRVWIKDGPSLSTVTLTRTVKFTWKSTSRCTAIFRNTFVNSYTWSCSFEKSAFS